MFWGAANEKWLARFNWVNLFVKQWSYVCIDVPWPLCSTGGGFGQHCLEVQLRWEPLDVAASSCPNLELVSCSSASSLALYTTLCSTGHEHPFSIALNYLRDAADQQQGTNNNTLLADGTEASFLDQLPKEKQCQFVLKPRLQAPVQLRRGRGCRSTLQPGRDCAASRGSAKLFLASYTYPRISLTPECVQREGDCREAKLVCATIQN